MREDQIIPCHHCLPITITDHFRGLTLLPAFCRMHALLRGSPSASGISIPHDRAIHGLPSSSPSKMNETILIIGIDGDLQQDSEDILKLLSYTATYDLVCGWRQQRQDGLVKKMSSRIANLVRDFFTHDGVHDTACPLKIFLRPLLERLHLFEGMHRLFPASRSCMGSLSLRCRSGITRAFTAFPNTAWETDYSNLSMI